MLNNCCRFFRNIAVITDIYPLFSDHLQEIPPDSEDLSFGNSVYKIRFESRDHQGIFGHKYWFYLRDAVEDVPEYVVLWDSFVELSFFQFLLIWYSPVFRLAAEYDLKPIYKEEFHQVFAQNQSHPDFGPLMVRMKVVDANGESSMDEDQWEAASRTWFFTPMIFY